MGRLAGSDLPSARILAAHSAYTHRNRQELVSGHARIRVHTPYKNLVLSGFIRLELQGDKTRFAITLLIQRWIDIQTVITKTRGAVTIIDGIDKQHSSHTNVGGSILQQEPGILSYLIRRS